MCGIQCKYDLIVRAFGHERLSVGQVLNEEETLHALFDSR